MISSRGSSDCFEVGRMWSGACRMFWVVVGCRVLGIFLVVDRFGRVRRQLVIEHRRYWILLDVVGCVDGFVFDQDCLGAGTNMMSWR